MEFMNISDVAWNRVVTIVGFLLVFVSFFISNRALKDWYKTKFGKKEIITTHNKINQVIHADIFSFQATVALNADGFIVSANKRAQKLFGWHEDELVGSKMDKIIADDSMEKFEVHKKQFSVVAGEDNVKEVELNAITRGVEEKKILRVVVGRWTDELDIYFTVVILDITHRRKNEEAIKVAEKEIASLRQLYHEGEKVGHVAFWKMDCQTGEMQYSPNFVTMYSVKGMQVSIENLVKRIIAEDRLRVVEVMKRAKDAKTGYDVEYKFLAMDGYINTMYSVVSAVKNKKGELTHFIGMGRLIKKEKPSWL